MFIIATDKYVVDAVGPIILYHVSRVSFLLTASNIQDFFERGGNKGEKERKNMPDPLNFRQISVLMVHQLGTMD